MGENCTRACGFCAVGTAIPAALDPTEPDRVAESALALDLKHVVVTSVNRDDLADGGAEHMFRTVTAIKTRLPDSDVEVLTPDFNGNMASVHRVAKSPLAVYNHNVETVPRLYSRVRPRADYERSLQVLVEAKKANPSLTTKSGIMVGLGETQAEVVSVMKDLAELKVDVVTIGQYLRPSLTHVPVVDYLLPEAYAVYQEIGLKLGFRHVFAGPFVRSSYNAAEALRRAQGHS